MAEPRKVLLTPLAFSDPDGHVVGIAIRDPATEEIIEVVVTSHDLAEKAHIPLADAQRIFIEAEAAARRKLAG